MTSNASEVKMRSLMRRQALLSGLGSLFSGLVYFAADFPFPAVIAAIALAAAVCYFVYYLLFDLIEETCYSGAGAALSVMGITALTLVVHFSGGIVSPFIFFYFCILILEALYGLHSRLTLPLAVAGYLLVVGGQYSGVLHSSNAWAAGFYRSPAAASLLAAITVVNLMLVRRVTRMIVDNLRAEIEQEGKENEALLRKFSELNSTMQLGVLAHRIAHDLRGPISCISGYLRLELGKEKKPEDKLVLKELDGLVSNMSESLDGITSFGKAGGPAGEKILLAEFMRDLVAIASFSPQARGVKFELRCPEKQKPCVCASRADLQQAYFNIIKNAVEAVSANPDGKKVEIAIEAEGKDVRISIMDDGPGIREDVHKNIFRKSVTTKKDGAGVGLLITRDLLLRNYGEIKLRNLEDGGLAVVTSLPAA